MAWKRNKRYRLQGFDYWQNGAYFITIVTKNRQPVFGEIVNDDIILSRIGKIVEHNMQHVSQRKRDIQIDESQIMPDHVHLIVTITNRQHDVPHNSATGLQPLIPGSVSAFINHLKGKVTRHCHEQNIEGFAWQAKFHDHIIRNEKEYHAIKKYIQNNIRDWHGRKNKHPD